MSQALTKPACPKATTCVTTTGWKYHSAIPLPPLYFGMTKSQRSGRAQNHKASEAPHIMVLHFLTSAFASLAYILPSPLLSKAHDQMHSLRFMYFHIVPWQVSILPLPFLTFKPQLSTLCCISLLPCISHTTGHQVKMLFLLKILRCWHFSTV